MLKLKVKSQIAAALVALTMILSASAAQAETAKNIILIIADVLSCNAIEATDLYNYFKLIYDFFPVQFGVSTFSKVSSITGSLLLLSTGMAVLILMGLRRKSL